MYDDQVPARFFMTWGAYIVGAVSVSANPALVPIRNGSEEVPPPVVWVLTLQAMGVFEATTTDPRKPSGTPGGESGV
jgi:hypothetical protein